MCAVAIGRALVMIGDAWVAKLCGDPSCVAGGPGSVVATGVGGMSAIVSSGDSVAKLCDDPSSFGGGRESMSATTFDLPSMYRMSLVWKPISTIWFRAMGS